MTSSQTSSARKCNPDNAAEKTVQAPNTIDRYLKKVKLNDSDQSQQSDSLTSHQKMIRLSFQTSTRQVNEGKSSKKRNYYEMQETSGFKPISKNSHNKASNKVKNETDSDKILNTEAKNKKDPTKALSDEVKSKDSDETKDEKQAVKISRNEFENEKDSIKVLSDEVEKKEDSDQVDLKSKKSMQ